MTIKTKKKKKKKKAECPYIRSGKYSVDKVIPFIGKYEKDYDGLMVKMGSQRYEVFKEKGLKCVDCGIVGSFFALEKFRLQENNRHHFNLYAIDGEGLEVLMTKDHIIPISKGGKNILSNYQTMCEKCNSRKGDKIE